MPVNPHLRILQYNIRNEKNGIMAPLLCGTAAAALNIIAMQELWQNPYRQTSFNPPCSGFHLAFAPSAHTRVCFYINKNLDSDCWEADSAGNPDIATLALQTTCGGHPALVHIHNLYSLSPHYVTAPEALVIEELTSRLRATPGDPTCSCRRL